MAASLQQPRRIRPSMITTCLLDHCLVSFPENPGICTCGWYIFYSTCGHMYGCPRKQACGRKKSLPLGKPVFCKVSAPSIIVEEFIVSVRCRLCRQRQGGE